MEALNVEVLVLTKGEIEGLITRREVLDATEMVFKAEGEGDLIQPQKEPLYMDTRRMNFITAMPAYLKNINTAGMKWASMFWDQEPGIPAALGGILILNNPQNGQPYALMDATAITHLRTAGGHALVAARHLAGKDSKVMTIIGCGAEARTGLPAFHDHFPLQIVKVYDRRAERMTAFKEEMAERVPVTVTAAVSPQEAVFESDIILMATSASTPLVLEPWVPDGCFVAGLNSFRDLDPLLTRKADKWVIGSRKSDGRLIVEDRTGPESVRLSWNNVYADMGEIVTGKKKGREKKRERIVYTHLGMGAHDIAVARIAYEKAKKAGMGRMVKLV